MPRENPLFSDLPPGMRMVAGQPYVFDLGAYGDWLAIETKLIADACGWLEPGGMAHFSQRRLDGAYGKALRLAAISEHRDLDLLIAVEAERARRIERRLGREIGRAQLKASVALERVAS